MTETLRIGGFKATWATHLATLLSVLVGLCWLGYPFINGLWQPSALQIARESPGITALNVLALFLLAMMIWRDSNRELGPLGIAVALIIANCLARLLFNAGFGFEFNYILPVIAGLAGGIPLGYFVGAGSCLLSQFTFDYIASPLPSQLLVWGLAGIIGGLLHKLPKWLGWILAVALSVPFGVVGGMLLNITGWLVDPQTVSSFQPVAKGIYNIGTLFEYSKQTSLGIDFLRGVCTAVGVFLIGYRARNVLQAAWAPANVDLTPIVITAQRPSDSSLLRHAIIRRVKGMWQAGDDK